MRISEYKTAPEVHNRHAKLGGGGEGSKFRRSSSPLIKTTTKNSSSAVPVLERKKMFEQTESANPTAASTGFGSVSGKRSSKGRKEIGRNSSFRGTKRLKGEDAHSPVLGRSKQLTSSSNITSLPLWKKLKNFGHFDLQSLAKDSLALSSVNVDTVHNVKKPTGASAAHEDPGLPMDKKGSSNALISYCTAFTNEIGGDGDWMEPGNPILILKEGLSVDKQRRVGSREKMIVDGEIPLKSMLITRGPMNKQVSIVLSPKTGLNYPFEFIDFGATYYRNYFLQQGEWCM